MKKGYLTLIALFFTLRLMAQGDRKVVLHLSRPDKTFTLNVNIDRAAIKVTGYEGKDVIIGIITEEPEVQGALQVTARENNNEVNVEAFKGKAVRLNIKVPQTPGVFKLSSINGGTITVRGVTGNLELQNKSGGIVAEDISGSVIAGTLSGRVAVSFRHVDPSAAMVFSTLSGAIDIAFPADLKANLKIRSDHGKIFSDFDLAGRSEKHDGYYLATNDWLLGRAGGGGPEFLFKNTNGNIHIIKNK